MKALRPRLAAAQAFEQAYADWQALVDPELEPLRAEAELMLQRAAAQLEAALVPDAPQASDALAARARVLVEVRQGVGGEEAALWARQVARMLRRHADRRGWHVDDVSLSPSKGGGLKECVFSVEGRGALALKEEAGIHRVQRVSPTDSRKRVHTSAASVAVLEEVDEPSSVLDPNDVEIELFHSQGPGGQNVNKVETGVRARHLPTGLTASSQTRSQGRNREEALRVLAARVVARRRQELAEETGAERRSQLGSGDRSEKMRTYDFPEGLVVDHRRGVKSHRLEAVLDGQLEWLQPARR